HLDGRGAAQRPAPPDATDHVAHRDRDRRGARPLELHLRDRGLRPAAAVGWWAQTGRLRRRHVPGSADAFLQGVRGEVYSPCCSTGGWKPTVDPPEASNG